MKCICGYDDDKKAVIESEFILTLQVMSYKDYRGNIRMGRVYICPKCGTLRLEH